MDYLYDFPSLLFCTQLILIDNFFLIYLNHFLSHLSLYFRIFYSLFSPIDLNLAHLKLKCSFNLFTKYPYNSILYNKSKNIYLFINNIQ